METSNFFPATSLGGLGTERDLARRVSISLGPKSRRPGIGDIRFRGKILEALLQEVWTTSGPHLKSTQATMSTCVPLINVTARRSSFSPRPWSGVYLLVLGVVVTNVLNLLLHYYGPSPLPLLLLEDAASAQYPGILTKWAKRMRGGRTSGNVPSAGRQDPRSAPRPPDSSSSSSSWTTQPASLLRSWLSMNEAWSNTMARPFFSPWNETTPDVSSRCLAPERRWFGPHAQQTPTREGLFFMKTYKTGSSTAAGIHLRIAERMAQTTSSVISPLAEEGAYPSMVNSTAHHYPICRARFDHAVAAAMEYGQRIRSHSLLWTVLRDPTARAVSQFFHFLVSRKNTNSTSAVFRETLMQPITRDYYLSVLSTQPYVPGEVSVDPRHVIQTILSDYDFIGITERMDESAVALQMMLGLSLGHVLYLDAKRQGGYDDGAGKRHCYFIQPTRLTDSMQQFLQSPEWQERVKYDQLLYQIANRSLDLTIDRLGRTAFEAQLAKFRQARQVAQVKCIHETTFPCTPQGVFVPPNQTNCIWHDSGCGHECLNAVAAQFKLWEQNSQA